MYSTTLFGSTIDLGVDYDAVSCDVEIVPGRMATKKHSGGKLTDYEAGDHVAVGEEPVDDAIAVLSNVDEIVEKS